MKNIRVIAAGILLSTLSSLAHAGTEGHGGDLLRRFFTEGRGIAQSKLASILPCSFADNIDANVQSWVLAHSQELATDIGQSQHIWITDPQATCAWTQTHSMADISLSFVTCNPSVTSSEDAAWILAHESTHHLGFSDEIFPEKVAQAVMTSRNVNSCDHPADPGKPVIVTTQAITGSYFRDCFSFMANTMATCSEANNGLSSTQAVLYTLDTSGATLQSNLTQVIDADITGFVAGNFIYSSGNRLLDASGRNLFDLYAHPPQGGNNILVPRQIEYTPAGFIYVLSDGSDGGQDWDSFVQVVNTHGIVGGWEQTLANKDLITTRKPQGLEPSTRIAVNDRWLAYNNPRPLTGTDGQGQPLEPGPFVEIFNIENPALPVRGLNLKTKANDNDLNGWKPILSGNNLFVPTANTLTAYDVASGTELGSLQIPEALVPGPQFISESTLYVASQMFVYAIDISNPSAMKTLWSLRVANVEASGVAYIHRFGKNLYVVWKDKNYGNGKFTGFELTTVSLP